MGGNAIKAVPLRRLPAAEYICLSAAACSRIDLALRELGAVDRRVALIPAYRTKPDFGDADILVESDGLDGQQGQRFRELLARGFGSREVVPNGSVTSYEFERFQVDVIMAPSTEFDFSLGYFSFNDLGNLIGRTAHCMGLKHGHDGLRYPVRDGDYLFKEIALTQQYPEALEFLGYDPGRFDDGFDSLEDIFRYVAESRYFSADIFLLENRNHRSKIRDRKRKTYTEFLSWCQAHPELPAYPYPEDKKAWLPAIYEAFPGFRAAHEQALAELEENRTLKTKFNGAWVSSVTGLKGEELGVFMRRFRESFGSPEAQKQFLMTNGLDVIEERVRALRGTEGGGLETPQRARGVRP